MKTIFLLLLLIPLQTSTWKLSKETDGIKVYYRKIAGRNLNELKMQTTIDAKLSTIVEVLTDVNSYKNWVYGTSYAKSIKDLGEREELYYDIVDFPWPLSDRDLAIHTKIVQNPETKQVKINLEGEPKEYPVQKNLVRIQYFKAYWLLTPNKDKVDLEYFLSSDPGGNLPDAVVNLALTEGPVRTLKSLKLMIKKSKYEANNTAKILN